MLFRIFIAVLFVLECGLVTYYLRQIKSVLKNRLGLPQPQLPFFDFKQAAL